MLYKSYFLLLLFHISESEMKKQREKQLVTDEPRIQTQIFWIYFTNGPNPSIPISLYKHSMEYKSKFSNLKKEQYNYKCKS